MIYVYFYLAVVVLCIGVVAYMCGRHGGPGKDGSIDTVDILIMLAFCFAWPAILLFYILFSPFKLIYIIGKRRRALVEEKKEMWDTLKR